MMDAKQKYDEYIENLMPIMYKVIGDYYYSKMEINSLYGLDISNVAWQIPFENLNQKDKDRFIESSKTLLNSMGKSTNILVLLLNTNLSIEDQIELSEGFEFIHKFNVGDFKGELGGDVVFKDEASDYLELAKRSYHAIMELAGNDGEFTDKVSEFAKELEKLVYKPKKATKK